MKLQLSKIIPLMLLFLVFFYFGKSSTEKSWDGIVYFMENNRRIPATTDSNKYDISHLSGHDYELASQELLIANAKITKRENDLIGITLGHYRGHDKKFACSLFKYVEMVFYSGSPLVNGKPSVMKVSTSCIISSEDAGQMQVIWIPFNQFYSAAPGDTDIQILTPEEIEYSFSNIGNSWPAKWHLQQIRIYNNGGQEVVVGEINPNRINEQMLNFEISKN